MGRGLRERCELSQRGLGQSFGEKQICKTAFISEMQNNNNIQLPY